MKDHIEDRDRGASRNEYLVRSRRSSADESKKGAVAERAHRRACVSLVWQRRFVRLSFLRRAIRVCFLARGAMHIRLADNRSLSAFFFAELRTPKKRYQGPHMHNARTPQCQTHIIK